MWSTLNNGGSNECSELRVVIDTIIDLTKNRAPDSAKRGLDFAGIRI